MSSTSGPDDGITHWDPQRHGYDWGEGTRQALAQRGEDPEQRPEWHTDAREIQLASALFNEVPAPFEPDDDIRRKLYIDTVKHEKPARETHSAGGTDWLRIGNRGCGKTTDNRNWAHRLMEVNGAEGEKVVWRGSSERSGWIAFREWATVWLPSNIEVDASWQYESGDLDPNPVDLDEVVRNVREYDDPKDLLDQLADEPGGSFHIVYPDPAFTGCSELTRVTDRVPETLPFTPKWATIGEESATPQTHWWYAFFLAAIEFRESNYWLSVIFDEAGDLTAEDVKEDAHKTYSKLNLLRSIYADSRRKRVSLYWSAHYEENLHHKIRREVERRISMPDGSPNPIKDRPGTHPVGFDTVLMYSDIIGHRDIGEALMYTGGQLFSLYNWKDLSRSEDAERWLSVSLGGLQETDDDDSSPSLQYDRAIFKRWTAGDEDRLYVRDPGDGYLDVFTGKAVEPLESPEEQFAFTGVQKVDGERLVSMRKQGTEEETVVARIPVDEFGLESD